MRIEYESILASHYIGMNVSMKAMQHGVVSYYEPTFTQHHEAGGRGGVCMMTSLNDKT